jgi:geranylgeranyl diphosphate synthase type II
MMKSYKELYAEVEAGIASLTFPAVPENLYAPISYMMSLGGKRLRPVLALMAADMFGADTRKSIHAALAVEMFHNFTLVHDDIMDQAPLRRGKPTVYRKWNQTVAILSGDLMMIEATQLLCKTETQNLRQLIAVFNKAAIEVCEGQQLDMDFETQSQVSADEYLHMITYKTAVLLGASLQLGAEIAGASPTDCEHMYAFGKNIGIAFQIQDDILDSFGEGDKVGKKIGGDIAANKKTILLIDALEKANITQRQALDKWLHTENDEHDTKINAILELYEQLNVQQRCEELKKQYLEEAFIHLDAVSVESGRKEILRQSALELMERMS